MGESVVSGVVTPDTFLLERNTSSEVDPFHLKIVEKKISTKEKMFVPEFERKLRLSKRKERGKGKGKGKEKEKEQEREKEPEEETTTEGEAEDEAEEEEVGIALKSVPVSQQQVASLSDEQVLAIACLAIRVEYHFGYDNGVDIEFAVLDGRIYLLQARPITTRDESGTYPPTIPHNTTQHNTTQHNTIQHDTTQQHNPTTAQHNTTTTQHNRTQLLSHLSTELAALQELDTPVLHEHDVYTLHNIGEMMPGAVTPLTFSTFGRYLDIAMRAMYGENLVDLLQAQEKARELEMTRVKEEILREGKRKGSKLARPTKGEESETTAAVGAYVYHFIGLFSGHLFLNLTQLYTVVSTWVGGSKESVDFSLCGYVTPVKPSPAVPRPFWYFFVRLYNTMRFIVNLLTVSRRIDKLAALVKDKYDKFDQTTNKREERGPSHIGVRNNKDLSFLQGGGLMDLPDDSGSTHHHTLAHPHPLEYQTLTLNATLNTSLFFICVSFMLPLREGRLPRL